MLFVSCLFGITQVVIGYLCVRRYLGGLYHFKKQITSHLRKSVSAEAMCDRFGSMQMNFDDKSVH